MLKLVITDKDSFHLSNSGEDDPHSKVSLCQGLVRLEGFLEQKPRRPPGLS